MEEKERYEYFFGTNTIKDNKTNQFYGCVVDLLNQQDKQIKKLDQENLSLKEQSIRDNQNWIEETTQLKQQFAEKRCEICGSKMVLGELGYYCNNSELHPIYPAPNEAKSDYEEITLLKQDYDAMVEREGLLRQQLTDKEKEIEKLNACVDFYKSYYISFKEKVIDELEKVKELMRSIDMPNKPELYNNDMFGAGFDSHYIRVKELIDNQIKQLKEMK